MRLCPWRQDDEGRDHLAAQRIRSPGDTRLGHRWMLEKGSFDLDGAHPVRGDFDHLIGASGEPDKAIVIDVRRIALCNRPRESAANSRERSARGRPRASESSQETAA